MRREDRAEWGIHVARFALTVAPDAREGGGAFAATAPLYLARRIHDETTADVRSPHHHRHI